MDDTKSRPLAISLSLPDTPPPRLYKYQALTAQALAALKVRTIWFARPSTLNDPFDCRVPWNLAPVTVEECKRLLRDTDDPRFSEIAQKQGYLDQTGAPTAAFLAVIEGVAMRQFADFARTVYEDRGVACFSEAPDNSLLWSHYGGAHRGICLEFDTSSPWLNRLHRVRYSDKLPDLNAVDVLLGTGGNIMSLLLTKAECWSYEREWRAIHEEVDKAYGYGVDGLKGIYLGAALTAAEKDLVAHIVHGTPTQLYEMRLGPRSFRIEAYPVQYTPYRHSQ